LIGTGRHNRTDTGTAQRNGCRPRRLTTTARELKLRIRDVARVGVTSHAKQNWPCQDAAFSCHRGQHM
jgi:hypothetical protein